MEVLLREIRENRIVRVGYVELWLDYDWVAVGRFSGGGSVGAGYKASNFKILNVMNVDSSAII